MTSWLLLAQSEPPPLSWSMRLPLSITNFLEFAIWGAWFVVLGNYLNSLQFSRKIIGRIYATMSLGAIIAPMFTGTIADLYFASEQLMGVLHLLGACLLFAMAKTVTPRPFYWLALAYALVYSPTLALCNAVIFTHIPDATRDFPTIRVLGTIGWIAAGLSLRLFIKPGEQVNNRPLLLAAGLSLLLGTYAFTLPETKPKFAGKEITFVEAAKQFWDPFLEAMKLFEQSSFAIFFGVSFLITIALAFYYSFTALYLEDGLKVKPENVGPMMTIGQWVEIIFMFTLPWFLQTLGMKYVLAIGMAAWALRYGLFALGSPFVLVLLGIGLHGICFDFFFGAGFIHVENTAPKEIRNSAQSLFGVLTYGIGMWLGTEASGWLNQWLTKETLDPQTGQTVRQTNWLLFWLIPCVGAAASLILFFLLFQAA